MFCESSGRVGFSSKKVLLQFQPEVVKKLSLVIQAGVWVWDCGNNEWMVQVGIRKAFLRLCCQLPVASQTLQVLYRNKIFLMKKSSETVLGLLSPSPFAFNPETCSVILR